MDEIEFKTLFENNTDLTEISQRLKDSEYDAESKNAELIANGITEIDKHTTPEHSRITHWKMHNEQLWTKTVDDSAKPGHGGLEKILQHIIKNRNPDMVRICIYKGKGLRNASPVLTKEINLTEGPAPQSLD